MLVALAALALASSPAAPKNTVSLNPLRYPFQHYNLELERALEERVSFFVSPVVYHHTVHYGFGVLPWPHDTTADAYGLDLGLRFFGAAAFEGWFAGPVFSAFHSRVDHAGAILEGDVFTVGAHGGWSMIWREWIYLSLGAGVGYGFATAQPPPGAPKELGLTHSGFAPSVRGNAGVLF
jgi:hypothetical protein